eukprot:SAG31_NODE_919_length_11010_cov_27.449821_3_plen_298_part_00
MPPMRRPGIALQPKHLNSRWAFIQHLPLHSPITSPTTAHLLERHQRPVVVVGIVRCVAVAFAAGSARDHLVQTLSRLVRYISRLKPRISRIVAQKRGSNTLTAARVLVDRARGPAGAARHAGKRRRDPCGGHCAQDRWLRAAGSAAAMIVTPCPKVYLLLLERCLHAAARQRACLIGCPRRCDRAAHKLCNLNLNYDIAARCFRGGAPCCSWKLNLVEIDLLVGCVLNLHVVVSGYESNPRSQWCRSFCFWSHTLSSASWYRDSTKFSSIFTIRLPGLMPASSPAGATAHAQRSGGD